MKCNPSLVAPLAGVICLLSPHAGHAADAVREAAIQFAGGWAETVAVFGVAGLSDPRAFLEHKDKLDPHRKVIRESGSKELRQAGEQLDKLISYVARAAYERSDIELDATKWVGPDEKPSPSAPYSFRDPKLNPLLGVNMQENDLSKISGALERTIVRFYKAAGIDVAMPPSPRESEKERTDPAGRGGKTRGKPEGR